MQGQFQHQFQAKSGDTIYVRPLTNEDAPLLVDVFNHMSSESRYKRFNQTLDNVVPNRVWKEAMYIAQSDPLQSRGLIAFARDRSSRLIPIGAARYNETAPGEAEVAISIRDDYQSQGIGTRLMRLLAYKAQEHGYKRLVAAIRNDNPGIWKVFNRLPFQVIRVPDGAFSEIAIMLDAERAIEDQPSGGLPAAS